MLKSYSGEESKDEDEKGGNSSEVLSTVQLLNLGSNNCKETEDLSFTRAACLEPDFNGSYDHQKKKGKRGKRIRLITNYVRVFVDNREGIYEYKATFSPPIDNLEIRKRFLTQFDDILKDNRVFDGSSLFLPFQLQEQTTVLKGFHPKHSEVRMKVVLEYSKRKPYRESVQFFNVLFRRVMIILGKFELKRSFFDPDIKFSLPNCKLEIWPGICSSIEEQEDGLMMCLDTSFRVFRTDTVYDYIVALNDTANWEENFKEYILGKVVVTTYNNFTYKIDDVDWERSPSSLFDCNGKQKTYVDYYKDQYKIDIVNPNQPLLLSRIKVTNGYRQTEQIKVISLIPELCYVCGMNQEHRNDKNVMKEVAQYTFCTPAQKLRALCAFLKRLNEIPEALAVLKSWNVRVDDKLLDLTGRQLPEPILQFQDKANIDETKTVFDLDPTKGIYDAIPLHRWLIICSQRDAKTVQQFKEHFQTICNSSGIPAPHPGEVVTLKGQSPQDFRDALQDYANPEKFQFVVVVMAFARREIYSVIKTICCSERPIPSQVIMAKTLNDGRNLSAMVKNIAMQINCKLGGSLWGLYIPLNERIMFVGIDVYHDVRKVFPSAVALIASMNNSCTKYFSKVHVQKIHQEITDNMQPLFSEALECFVELNGAYPDRVIIFRDGGSLAAMPLLIEHEVKPMLAAIKMLCPKLKNFTYTVVSKRVPQRLFICDKAITNNPNPGVVVDESITYPNMFDFYIVSQQKCQGTVNPTHYMVIFDMGGIKADLLQQLAYSTTYMYFNWCGSIRVPAMIQYAHKLSALVGQNLRNIPSSNMDKLLYYL